MPKIDIVRGSRGVRGGNSIATLQPGETFRYKNGAADKVYMKLEDGTAQQGWSQALMNEYSDHSIVDLETGNVFNVENPYDSEVVHVTCSLGVKE